MYKLMDNGGLPACMHLCSCIGYTFQSSFITHKHYVEIKYHNDGVMKAVTPYSYK